MQHKILAYYMVAQANSADQSSLNIQSLVDTRTKEKNDNEAHCKSNDLDIQTSKTLQDKHAPPESCTDFWP